MRNPQDFFIRGAIVPPLMGAAVVLALFAVLGITLSPDHTLLADMRLSPTRAHLEPGETFSVSVIVESPRPVNVFSGELHFNPDVLEVAAIDYNTSIADLWAEKPWFENGAGTINFIGGTTQKGGFTGTGDLLTITFKGRTAGEGVLTLINARILEHNGMGTDIPLHEPIDALFTVTSPQGTSTILFAQDTIGTAYSVRIAPPSPDLNGDGKQTFADVSILLLNLASSDSRFDLNQDGKVTNADVKFLLEY